MITRLLRALALLCFTGLLASAARAAAEPENTPPPDEKNSKALAVELQKMLRSDPLFKNQPLKIDLYHGLAIIHGAASNNKMVEMVDDKVKRLPGVVAVFNYMTSPDHPVPTPGAVNVTYDTFARINEVGNENNAFLLAARVKDRLEADNRLQGLDLSVDSYRGLVILHGAVPDSETAKLVKDVALHTSGVNDVLSYMTISSLPAMAPLAAAPILVRPAVTERIPASFETRTNCGCE